MGSYVSRPNFYQVGEKEVAGGLYIQIYILVLLDWLKVTSVVVSAVMYLVPALHCGSEGVVWKTPGTGKPMHSYVGVNHTSWSPLNQGRQH